MKKKTGSGQIAKLILPQGLVSDRLVDGVLHCLLVAHATFMRTGAPIRDGGLLVPCYTASLSDAADLFDHRFKRGSWTLRRLPAQDNLVIETGQNPPLMVSVARGEAALALSAAVLVCALESARGLTCDEATAFLATLPALSQSVDDRRAQRLLA